MSDTVILAIPWRERRTAQGCTVRTRDERVRDETGTHLVRHIELSCEESLDMAAKTYGDALGAAISSGQWVR